ncbi:MAG: VCBS repeat-containing protein [Bacteroidota bacterium]
MKRIIFILLAFAFLHSAFSQTKMIINKTGGTADSLLLSEIKSITFGTVSGREITSIQLTGSQATAKDASGNALWTYTAPSTILCYELSDVDKDGKTEVLLGTSLESKGLVICVENDGTKAWDFQTGATGVYWPDDSFNCCDIDVADVDNDGSNEIVSLSQESPWYPQRLCVLSVTGSLEGDYWHPGYGQCDEDNLIVGDLNGDGVYEIIVGSHNNDLGGIEVIYLLEGNNVHGQAPPYYGTGAAHGTEMWYKQGISNPVQKIEVVSDRNSDGWKDLKVTLTNSTVIYVNGKTGGTIS